MNSQEKQGYITEINYQKDMIKRLSCWLRNIMICSSIGILLIYFFSTNLLLSICGYSVIVICVIGVITIGLAIYRGRLNINKIIKQMESKI